MITTSIARQNFALDWQAVGSAQVSGMQRQNSKQVEIFSEESKETKEQKKNKKIVLVAESAENSIK